MKTVLFFLPSFLLTFFPSFDLGLLVQTPPSIAIPDTLVSGDPFIWKDSGEIDHIQMNGRALARITKPEAMFFGVADLHVSDAVEFSVVYAAKPRKLSLDLFKPKFEHPKLAYYTKRVKVDAPANNEDDETDTRRPASTEANDPSVIDPAILPAFSRRDGNVNLGCWKTPALKEVPPPPALTIRHVRKSRAPFYSVSTAAAGEVVYAGDERPKTAQGKVVVLYHGGGFFSQYRGLKDFRARKGDKVKAGQEIGTMAFHSKKEAEKAEPLWDVRWGTTPVTPPSFISLSSQLCGST